MGCFSFVECIEILFVVLLFWFLLLDGDMDNFHGFDGLCNYGLDDVLYHNLRFTIYNLQFVI